MIISPNRRFVFIHLHKCAGTSIERALEPCLRSNDLVLGSTKSGERNQPFFRKLTGLAKHSPADKAQSTLGAAFWNSAFTFTFVRHPVDRLRSLYSYKKTLTARRPLDEEEQGAFDADGTLPARPPYRYPGTRSALEASDFNEFVLHASTWADPGAHAMWKGVCDSDGQPLVKFVGKLERLAEDWANVQEQLEIKLAVGHHNASAADKVPAELMLSAEAWAVLEEHYGRDCEIFGYQLRDVPGA